ncbi:hypothetical protein ACTS9D_07040 [Empedobacter brevis]
MSIKLLAIRPLKGCDDKFLKNLKKNCIYRLYNEYDYKYQINSESNSEPIFESYIEYQSKIDSDSEIEFINIDNVTKNKQIPDNFYSNNINISAIVGKNGSGKSGLLELIYAFNYNLSKHFNIENFNESSIPFCEINLELFFEVIVNKKPVFYKISHKSNKKVVEFNFYKQDNPTKKLIKLTKNYNTEDWKKFYYLIINYSLYGLNSLVNGEWIRKLFHKNDGYQTPITINPFRNNGIIDVNAEYNLAQSRLILSKYLIKDEYLLKGIDLGKIDYYLNTHDVQHNKDGHSGSKNLVIKEVFNLNKSLFPNNTDLNEFISIIFKQEVIGLKDLLIYLEDYAFEILEINNFDSKNIFRSDINLIEIEDGNTDFLNTLKKLLKNKEVIEINKIEDILLKKYLIDHLKKKQKNNLQYLCFLYIFNKIKKISQNYSEYKIYNFLFDEMHNLSDLLWSELSSSKTRIIEKYFDNKKDNSISLERISHLNSNEVNNLKDIFIKNSSFFKSLGFEEKEIYENVDFKFENHIKLFELNNKKVLNEKQFLEIINKAFLSYINDNKQKVFKEYINRLYEDESHITFKLRQVLSYFKFNIFDSITIKDYNKQKSSHEIEINKNYYEGKSLAEVPLSFFKPEINITKNKEIYPFNRLSSGEQQMIHSLLNIKYHLYNLASNKKDHILTYRNINIIFDEVELYFHPEYQKQFIFELIRHLKKLKEFKFNIIFATHSPFILSDIPSQNVLKLNEGLPIPDNDGINSFGSNIHDLLADEFFLESGTIGKFAEESIKEMIVFFHKLQLADLSNDTINLNILIKEYKSNKDKFKFLSEYTGENVYQTLLKNHLEVINVIVNKYEKN